MRKTIIFLILYGFVTSCAPHIDYYKPLNYTNKKTFKNFKNIDDFYYTTMYNDSTEIRTKLIVNSLPKKKEFFFKIHIDSIRFLSNRIKLVFNHKNINDKIFTDEYSASVNLNDNDWYGSFVDNKDTLNVLIFYENKKMNLTYYFNYKNSLETYPY